MFTAVVLIHAKGLLTVDSLPSSVTRTLAIAATFTVSRAVGTRGKAAVLPIIPFVTDTHTFLDITQSVEGTHGGTYWCLT